MREYLSVILFFLLQAYLEMRFVFHACGFASLAYVSLTWLKSAFIVFTPFQRNKGKRWWRISHDVWEYQELPSCNWANCLASPSLLGFLLVGGRNVLILRRWWCQAQPSLCQTVWVDVLWLWAASSTHRNGTQLAPQGNQTLYCLFPSSVISPPLILSSLIFLQQSITTMPGERRSCHCRLETLCTYLRHTKVGTGFLIRSEPTRWCWTTF